MSAPTVRTPQGYEDQAQKEPIAREYHRLITSLDVALVVSKKERGYREAVMFEGRPNGYKSLTADGNEGRLQDWVYGDRVEMLTGPVLAAIDVDTKNGGNVENTRAWLQDLGVEVANRCAGNCHELACDDLAAILMPAEGERVGQERMHAIDRGELLGHGVRGGVMIGG